MVTKKELSGFKETLATALQKAGYTAYGRISSSDYNFYANVPEQEIVSHYVEDKNLDEINKVYRVIQFINENSDNHYSLKILCKEHSIDYKVFAHVVENLPYIDKTGERRKTQYHWIHEEEPSYTTAKDIVDHLRMLKATKLNEKLKDKISKAVAEGISKDEFLKTNTIKKEATYSVEAYYNYQKTQQKNKENNITETVHDNTPGPEITSDIAEIELQDNTYQRNGNEEVVLKDENALTSPEVLDEAGLQMENYILRQEIRYLRKINNAKDKLIKALRKRA